MNDRGGVKVRVSGRDSSVSSVSLFVFFFLFNHVLRLLTHLIGVGMVLLPLHLK